MQTTAALFPLHPAIKCPESQTQSLIPLYDRRLALEYVLCLATSSDRWKVTLFRASFIQIWLKPQLWITVLSSMCTFDTSNIKLDPVKAWIFSPVAWHNQEVSLGLHSLAWHILSVTTIYWPGIHLVACNPSVVCVLRQSCGQFRRLIRVGWWDEMSSWMIVTQRDDAPGRAIKVGIWDVWRRTLLGIIVCTLLSHPVLLMLHDGFIHPPRMIVSYWRKCMNEDRTLLILGWTEFKQAILQQT